MKIAFADAFPPKTDTLVFPVADDKKLPPQLAALDKKASGLIARAVAEGRFTGKKGQALALGLAASATVGRVLLVGIGAAKDADALRFEQVGGAMIPALNASGAKAAVFVADLPKGVRISPAEAAAHAALGANLRSYRFDKYKTKVKPEDKPTLSILTFTGGKAASAVYARLEPIGEAVRFTRDLVSEPANIIYPETLADACRSLEKLGVQVEVLGEDEMHRLGMGALLGVGQGSARESQMVVMRWMGAANKKSAPVAFVGKGVTFDTGGISIKPANGMDEMKWDMGGAGAVIGLLRALAARKAKVNAVGVVGLVENMPGGNAQRPGDVVTSMSGQTIEVLNTDAEGRLVLADALWYAQDIAKPKAVIDLATLTGAVIVALGSSRAGLFANDDTLAQQLFDTGKATGEELWRLPLGEVYDKQIDSDIADMQNIGADREAGSTMGAVFLQRFIKEGTPWAHLDIAGTAWRKKDADTCPKGATAYGVRLLDAWVAKFVEDKK